MEEVSVYEDPELQSTVCSYLNRALTLSYDEDDDDDCDPLGSPERIVTINDDWTVTRDDPLPVLRYDSEDDADEENDDDDDDDDDDDGRCSEELENDEEDDLYVAEHVRSEDNDDDELSFKRINYRSLLRNNSDNDSEDQTVPSIPTHGIDKSLKIVEESSLSVDEKKIMTTNE